MTAAQAKPIAQVTPDFERNALACGFPASDPKSWETSGGEKLLVGFLEKNGPGDRLQKLSDTQVNGKDKIDCSLTDSTSCDSPEPEPDCTKQDYQFVRIVSSEINSAFKLIGTHLDRATVNQTLGINTMITDFDFAKELEESNVPGILKNIALGPATIGAVAGAVTAMPPAGPIVAGIMGIIAAALGGAADNLEKQPKPEFPKYEEFASKVGERLAAFFWDTHTELDATLKAIFGKHKDPVASDELVRQMIGRMTSLVGVKGIDGNAKLPIAELFKSGDWLLSDAKENVGEATKAAMIRVRQGLVGELLGAMHVYVEQEMPAYNEGAVPCEGPASLKEGNSCYVVKNIAFGKIAGAGEPIDVKYIEKLKNSYGVDKDVLIRNVADCANNGMDSKAILTDGSYPKCFFNMPFAQRVHEKDVAFQKGLLWTVDGCVSDYQGDLEKVPEWIRGTCMSQIPNWKPCKVIFEETSYWTEGGLDRYRMGLVGENIDMAPACPYALSGDHCWSGSNKQCYHNTELNKWVFDVNFAKGLVGLNDYKACRDVVGNSYANDNRCEHN